MYMLLGFFKGAFSIIVINPLERFFKKQNHGYFSQQQPPKTALELSVEFNKKKSRLSAKNSKNRSKTN